MLRNFSVVIAAAFVLLLGAVRPAQATCYVCDQNFCTVEGVGYSNCTYTVAGECYTSGSECIEGGGGGSGGKCWEFARITPPIAANVAVTFGFLIESRANLNAHLFGHGATSVVAPGSVSGGLTIDRVVSEIRRITADAAPLNVVSAFTNLNGGGYPTAFRTESRSGFLLATSAQGATTRIQVRSAANQRVLSDETVTAGDLVLVPVVLTGHFYVLALQTRSVDTGNPAANSQLQSSIQQFTREASWTRSGLSPNPYRMPDCP